MMVPSLQPTHHLPHKKRCWTPSVPWVCPTQMGQTQSHFSSSHCSSWKRELNPFTLCREAENPPGLPHGSVYTHIRHRSPPLPYYFGLAPSTTVTTLFLQLRKGCCRLWRLINLTAPFVAADHEELSAEALEDGLERTQRLTCTHIPGNLRRLNRSLPLFSTLRPVGPSSSDEMQACTSEAANGREEVPVESSSSHPLAYTRVCMCIFIYLFMPYTYAHTHTHI